LVQQYVKLNQVVGRFPQVQSGRYVYFLSDFLRCEKGATRVAAIQAWKELKRLDIPNTYSDWKKHKRARQ